MIGACRTTALAAAVVSLGMGACSDGGSREDYAERLNEICEDVESKVNELDSTRAETPQEAAALIEDVIAETRRAARRVEGVERPDGDAGEEAERFVRTLQREVAREAIPALEDLRAAVRAQDPFAADEAGDRLRALENSESDRQARRLGAEACAT
ncbi:MAG TPA: hypothetical protein VHF45_05790 [Thermoleophilaceae bacterium]|nr:hypothetical protein [Thermoleophilaceae bacterium]